MFSLFLALSVRSLAWCNTVYLQEHSGIHFNWCVLLAVPRLLSDLVLEDARSSHWSVLCLLDAPRYKAAHFEFQYIFYLLCLLIHEKNKTRKKQIKN